MHPSEKAYTGWKVTRPNCWAIWKGGAVFKWDPQDTRFIQIWETRGLADMADGSFEARAHFKSIGPQDGLVMVLRPSRLAESADLVALVWCACDHHLLESFGAHLVSDVAEVADHLGLAIFLEYGCNLFDWKGCQYGLNPFLPAATAPRHGLIFQDLDGDAL